MNYRKASGFLASMLLIALVVGLFVGFCGMLIPWVGRGWAMGLTIGLMLLCGAALAGVIDE